MLKGAVADELGDPRGDVQNQSDLVGVIAILDVELVGIDGASDQ